MRQGQFSRSAVQYGQALSVIKPPDNDPGSYISPELKDTALALTLAQQYELQQRIDDLYAMMKGEREYYPRP
jgi:hypothetical protein